MRYINKTVIYSFWFFEMIQYIPPKLILKRKIKYHKIIHQTSHKARPKFFLKQIIHFPRNYS